MANKSNGSKRVPDAGNPLGTPDWEHTCFGEQGDNVEIKVYGSKLVIEVDLSKRGALSKSGKSFNIGTTRDGS
jgi:hypothetical protein